MNDIPSMDDSPTPAPAAGGGAIPPMEDAPKPQGTGAKLLKSNAKNLLSVADMVGSIPAALVGTMSDAAFRVRAIAKGEDRREVGREGNIAYQTAMEQYGNPFSKLLHFAGLGAAEGENPSGVDGLMTKAANLLDKGGEWAEKHSGGAVQKEDITSLTNEALALAGGRGVKAGLLKMAKSLPDVTAKGLMRGPETERAGVYKQTQEAQEKMPTAPSAVAEQGAKDAEQAVVAKTKITDPKNLTLDPVTGKLSEAIPDMGTEMPKPSALETGLDKTAGGRRFDMTAEERIAVKGLQDKPLDQPIVDEQGNILDKEAFRKTPAGAALSKVDPAAEWAKGTKVTDIRGNPKMVYHGTYTHFDKFDPEEIGQGDGHADWGDGHYFTDDPQAAGQYANTPGGNIRPAYLQMKNPARLKDIQADPELRDSIGEPDLGEKLKAKGFDGAIIEHPNGAKEYVVYDTKQIHGRWSSQAGSIDPKLMARLAAVGLGAWAGAYFSDSDQLENAALGGAGALAATMFPARAAAATFKKMFSADTRLNINELADAHEKYTRLAAHDAFAVQKQIEELAPKAADRAAITHAIEANDFSKLTPEQVKAANIAKDYFNSIGQVASLEGVLKSARDNYVTHIWDWSKNKSLFQKWMDSRGGGPGMGVHNRFAEERTIPTIEEGKRQGLTPLTEDISQIVGIYGNSMSRSIANSVFTRALKEEKVPGTNLGLVTKAEDAPHSYVSINNPAMQGLKVHPDIAPSLKMLYDTNSPGAAMKILMGVSDSSKRVAVGFSLFHAKALTDAMIGGSKVLNIPGNVGRAWRGAFQPETNFYLQELKKGSASPLVERAAEGGLKYSLEGEGAGVEDAGNSFYSAMTSVQNALDNTIPHAGLPVKGIIAMNKKIDTLMWARLHAGMKLNIFAEKYQTLLDNAAKDPQNPLTPDQAARIAASYTNDLFGGLNWRRVAEDSKTYLGKQVGQAMLNPGARRVMGILMFAPDWTISTTRAAIKAFGKPDFLHPTTLAGLHQQYLIRAAAYYLVVGDAINYSMSGHHLWENKDPTVLDMDPKGETHMQWSKHTMEPVHWLTKPAQQGINKMGIIPRELTEQALGVDYLSAKGRMPPIKDRVKHLVKNFEPISAQQADQGGAGSVVAGFAGVPIYGKTAAQKAKDKAERDRKKRKK